jgi:hypothetical protein
MQGKIDRDAAFHEPCSMLFRLRLAVISGALLAACSAPPRKEPSFVEVHSFDPLSACLTTGFGRYARSVSCGGTELLFVSRPSSPEALFEQKRALWSAYGVPVDERSLLFGGRENAVLGYAMGPFESASVSALFAALPVTDSQESIEVQCYHRGGPVDPKRCSVLLDAFVKQGLTHGEWPASLSQRDPQAPRVLDLVGRPVRLPASCEYVAPLELTCRDGDVRLVVAETEAQLSGMLAADLQVAAQGQRERRWQAPCTVDSTPTTCTLTAERVALGQLVTLRAALMLREHPVMLACTTKRSPSSPLPGPLCGQLFGVDAEAFAEPEPED